jgi:hypothetical protein
METMNRDFYNRMIKSTKRLLDANTRKDASQKELQYSVATPTQPRVVGRAYKRNASTMASQAREKSLKRINKTNSTGVDNLNSLMYASFDYRKSTKPVYSNNKDYWCSEYTERRRKRLTTK